MFIVYSLPASEAGQLWREISEEQREKYHEKASILKAEAARF